MAIAPLPLPEYAKQPKGSIWSFEGRIGRGTFWAAFASLFLLNVLVRLLLLGISNGGREMQPLVIVVALPAFVALLWLGLAIQVKRWHDLDHSGWMVLLNLTIIAVPIVLIILGCVKGTVGPNKYGADPLQTHLGAAVPAPEVQAIPAPEAQAPVMTPVGRVFGIFFSPKKTFEDIVRRPSWVLPVVISTVLGLLVCVGINQRINWHEFISQQIEKSPQAAQLSTEQKEQRIEGGAKIAPYTTYVFGTLGPVVVALLVGLAMWGAYSLFGGISTNFSTAFGVTAHAFMTGIVSSPLFILILYLKPPGTVDLENPVATNLAAILSDDSAKWLVALLKSFDIFVFWTLILLAIGFAAVNPRKLKGAKSFTIAFTVWAVYVVLRVGVAFITS